MNASRNANDLRAVAKGRSCTVRLPGCLWDGDTVVLAHYSLAGVSGRGLKSPDECGAWCCHARHQAVDGTRPIPGYSKKDLRLALAEGFFRTLAVLHAEGYAMRKGA